jgi:hypothetical protein
MLLLKTNVYLVSGKECLLSQATLAIIAVVIRVGDFKLTSGGGGDAAVAKMDWNVRMEIFFFGGGVSTSVGINKHFVYVEIPGFDMSNMFSGLTTSLLFRDRIHRVIFNKHE